MAFRMRHRAASLIDGLLLELHNFFKENACSVIVDTHQASAASCRSESVSVVRVVAWSSNTSAWRGHGA
jgi:hypothetical protein